LRPTTKDYFVLKPKHSKFFDTTLDTLLKALCIRRVILTGIAGHDDFPTRMPTCHRKTHRFGSAVVGLAHIAQPAHAVSRFDRGQAVDRSRHPTSASIASVFS
jgi:hypothetical protein